MSVQALVRPVAAGVSAAAPGRTGRRSSAIPEVRRGALAMLPVLIGYAPVAAVVGNAIARHDEPLAAWMATGLIYGGAAQLAVLATLSAGAGVILATAAGLVVNTRLAAYAATMGRHWRDEPLRFRVLASALLTDVSWMLGLARYDQPGTSEQKRWHYLGAGTTLFVSWVSMVTTAALVGRHLPFEIDLTVAMPLCLLAMVSPGLRSWGGAAAAAGAGIVAFTTGALPAGAGIIVAAVAGAIAGCFVDHAARRRGLGGQR
jgi:predicted branched-subunit amino acid permease